MEIEAECSGTTTNNAEELVEEEGGGGSDRWSILMGDGKAAAAAAVYLLWEDLTVLLPNFIRSSGGGRPRSHTKRLLNAITGFALPGRIMAIMGPSGSGKSTLLDSLAGRLSGTLVMTGNILLNGKKKRASYGGLAYVTQEDVFLGTLTVRETIRYSAELRLSTNKTKTEVQEIVETTIMEMGLQDCADNLIGNWHLRGISGGEKKRLSIALEILTQPNLLFLDEPTTGLDGASAFFVTTVLKNIAFAGKTVVSSIHQPSGEVFALFDDLFLLSGGQTVYFGEANGALQFFADSGFPCPKTRNPSDHFLRCTNSDFDEVNDRLNQSRRIDFDFEKNSRHITRMATAEIREKLIQNYRSSKYAAVVKARSIDILSLQQHTHEELETEENRAGNRGRWFKQLTALTRRSFTNMSRDFGYYWLRIVVYVVVSICVGTVFYDVGTNYRSILARGACGGFVSGFMAFMSIGGFPCFIEEMKIFEKERFKGHYGVGVFILSNLISSFPFLILMTLSSVSITYFVVKFRTGFYHFMYAALDLLISIAIVESCMMVVASLVPNFMMGIIVGAGFIGIMMATAGFFRLLPELPKPFWRYPISYINFMSWGLQGAYKNDMIGLEFDPPNPSDPKLKGEYILKTILGFSTDHSKWWDLAAVFAIFICYRMLFYFILKFKEKASPAVRTLYEKKTLQHLSKRASFRKTISFPSKRHHQTFHPLSSQEGLNSPLH